MKIIQAEALELFTKKNADYGDAFAKYGVIGVLMRIEDKLQRSVSMTKALRRQSVKFPDTQVAKQYQIPSSFFKRRKPSLVAMRSREASADCSSSLASTVRPTLASATAR